MTAQDCNLWVSEALSKRRQSSGCCVGWLSTFGSGSMRCRGVIRMRVRGRPLRCTICFTSGPVNANSKAKQDSSASRLFTCYRKLHEWHGPVTTCTRPGNSDSPRATHSVRWRAKNVWIDVGLGLKTYLPQTTVELLSGYYETCYYLSLVPRV